MIDNKTPFSLILDSYENECFNIYAVVKSLLSYNDIYNNDFVDEEGLLYATGFSLLCERYVFFTTQNQGNYIEDFEGLHYELKFETPAENFEDDVIKTKALIVKDVKKLFTSEKKILKFFSAIFRMEIDSESYIGNYENALEFYNENIK